MKPMHIPDLPLPEAVDAILQGSALSVPNTRRWILCSLAILVSDNRDHYQPDIRALMDNIRTLILQTSANKEYNRDT
jgi:hypothetical protein